MKATPTSLSSRFNAKSKENFKTHGLIATQNESNPKLSFNPLPISARQHFSSLLEANTPNNLKHQFLSSALTSTKHTASNSIHAAGSNASSRHGSRVNPQVSIQNALADTKKDLSYGKSLLDANKSPVAKKATAESSKIGAFTKKADFFAAAHEFNRSQSKSKTKSQGTSKGESLILDLLNNPVESRKDRLFGSYEPTPTNSPDRKPFLRTEASESDRKNKELDSKEYASVAKRLASPTTKLFTTQHHTQANIDRFNSNRINHFLNQKFDNFVRVEKSPSNFPSSNIMRPGMLSNELRTVSSKSNERSVSKANARLIHESDYKKHNSSNESVKLGPKFSASTKSSNAFKNKATFIQLDESNKTKQISVANPGLCVSPSALYQRLALLKEISVMKDAHAGGTPSTQFKVNFQDSQRINSYNSERTSSKKAGSHQTKGSVSGVPTDNEKSVNSNRNSLAPEGGKRLTFTKNNSAKSHSIDADSTYNTLKPFSVGAQYDGKNSLSQSKPMFYSATHTEEVPIHLESETGFTTQFSQGASNNISRSQSSIQMLQENFDFEKKRADAIKNRISFHLDTLKLSKEIADFSNRLSNPSLTSGKTYVNNIFSSSQLDKSYPKSTKNSASPAHFDFGMSHSHHLRGSSLDNASPLTQKLRAENANISSLPSNTSQMTVAHVEDELQGSKQDAPIMTLDSKLFYKQGEIKSEKGDKDDKNVSTLSVEVDMINFEEIPMPVAEKRMNSVNKSQIYRFEADHTDVLHDTHIEAGTKPEKPHITGNCENEGEQMHKVIERMKGILEFHRLREFEWQKEKSQMQERIQDLEKLLARQFPI